jgi:hypothetical protein
MSKDRHLTPVGPNFEAPSIPGGVILNQPQQPRTVHETTFMACQILTQAVIDDEGTVLAVQFMIIDGNERHRYILNFMDDVRDEIMSKLTEIPRCGEKVPEEEGGA